MRFRIFDDPTVLDGIVSKGPLKNYIHPKFFNAFNFRYGFQQALFLSRRVRWAKNFFLSFFDKHLINYPTPINLNYAWSFGSAAGLCLLIQIVSGIFLAMHYTPQIDLAFSSVEHIMRDVNYG